MGSYDFHRVAVAPDLWHHGLMAKRPAAKRDFMQVARGIVEQAIGEQMDGAPIQDQNAGKNQSAMERGRIGGLKGGHARAIKLTAEQRKEIAVRAAKMRWLKPEQKKGYSSSCNILTSDSPLSNPPSTAFIRVNGTNRGS